MRIRAVALLSVLALGGLACVVYAEVTAGDARAVQQRDGAVLRAEPRAFATASARLPFGTRVTVQEVIGLWARVTATSGETGWLRTSDIVQAGALTSAQARTGSVASADVSLAGRQFDDPTEQAYKATRADLEAAYRLVDQIEARTAKAGSPELVAFIRDGRLGGSR